MTGKNAVVLFLSFMLAFAVGMGVLSATSVIPYPSEPTPADPWENPSITTVIERPVTDIELVVGLAEIVSDQGRKIKRLTGELEMTRREAQQIIRAMMDEIERLRRGEEGGTRVVPPNCLPDGPCIDV